MRFAETIYRIIVVLIPTLLYGLIWWRANQIPLRRTPHNSRLLARKMTPLILICAGISVACICFGTIASTFVIIDGANAHHGWAIFEEGVRDFWAIVFFASYAIFGILLSAGTRRLFAIRKSLRTIDDSEEHPSSTEGNFVAEQPSFSIGTIVFSAFSAMVVLSAFLGLGFFILSALLFGLIPLLFWQRRRAREGQFLWLLALSVRNNHNLAQEIEDHAATWTGSYATRLRQLAVYLKAGRPLGLALERVPGLLPRWVIAAIKIGDETGTLSEVLNECATTQLNWMKERFRTGSIGSLLIYLACYPWVILGPVSFMMYYIVPKMKAIFEGFGTDLPDATEGFLAFSDHLVNYFYLYLPLMSGSFLGVLMLLRFDHSGWRNVRTRLLRSFYPRFDTSPIMRHLARMIDKGKTLPDSLLAIANSYHRPTVAESIAQVYVETESGGDCWKSLLNRGFLSRRDLALIEAAKRSNNVPWALREIADLREKRYIFRVDTLVQLFRPVPIIAVGLMVAWVCIAMFMPVVKLVNDLS